MGNGLSRVTVISADRRMDLALPDAVPVGELMPQLLELCTDHDDRTQAVTWMLRPLGGTGLGWASTLESARVRDGAILELCPRSAPTACSLVEDVRDATEDAVDRTVGIWSRRNTATMAMLTLAALAIVLLGLPYVWTASSGNGIPTAGMMAALAIWGSVTVQRKGLDVAAHVLLAVGLAWTGALVMTATAASGLTQGTRTGLTCAAILSAAHVATWAVPRFAAWSASAAAAFCVGLGWAALDLAGRSTQDAIAVGSVLGVLILGVLPRASLAAGGLAGLDYAVRTHGGVAPATVASTFERSRALLTGALLTIAVLTAAGSVQLGRGDSPLQLVLAAAIAVCLLLRARAFTQFVHVLALVLAGTCALLLQAISDLIDGLVQPTTLVILGAVAAASTILTGSSLSPANDVAGARSRRLLDTAESLAVASLIPLLAANLGVVDWVGRLVG